MLATLKSSDKIAYYFLIHPKYLLPSIKPNSTHILSIEDNYSILSEEKWVNCPLV
jgi:hypothetical protein